jgi:2-polyprenyl-6-methoxyphenol hydroxylase-like FAD-dependent oxidoreductase
VLIVGGGVGGMSCAISLRRAGISVDLVEIDPTWKIYGAGITITGPTLRALQTLGVLDEVTQHGATWEGAYVYSQTGQLIEELNFPPIAADLPGTGGIMRPEFTGQVIYRIVAERPPGFDRTHFYMGPDSTLGFNPVSRTHLYRFLLQRSPSNPWIAVEDQPRRLYDSMSGWGGIAPEVRKTVMTTNAHTINYRPLEAVLLPNPWYRDRVILIGDAAHAATPHLASGAGMAVEDGIVLAEEVTRDADIDAALPRFMKRRYERGKLVAENSLRLGELEMTHGSPKEHSRVMMAAVAALAQPA